MRRILKGWLQRESDRRIGTYPDRQRVITWADGEVLLFAPIVRGAILPR